MTKNEFFYQVNKKFFIDDVDKVAEYVKDNCKSQINDIIKVADDVVNKSFLFNLRWDMERTYVPVKFDDKINWLHMPDDDPEWIYAFNRHRFWICLGQAYAITGDEKYADAFVYQMTDWIENVKLSDKQNGRAWRTIEAGLRLEYWLKAFCYFEKSPALTDRVCDIFYNSIIEHSEFLMGIYDTFRLVSNWGVLQNHGLFLAGVMLPATQRTKEYQAEALRRLTEEITIQIYNDGVHWEQSPMYHNEVLHCYLDIKILAYRNNIALPEIMEQKLYKMCMATMHHKKPNHMELSMGDSDDIDVRDLLSKAAYLFHDSTLKFAGYDTLDFDSVWDLGFETVEKYKQIKSKTPQKTAIELKESGNYYLHSDWSENENFLHFFCGTLGAGHGHSDTLHFDLFANGEDILLDSGRYTYVDKPIRYEFKDPSAHNTIIVDNKNFINWEDSWGASKLSKALNRQLISTKNYDFIEGGNLGYYDLETGTVFINRRIIYIKPDIYIIVDEMFANSNHTYNQFFHFNNNGNLQQIIDGDFLYNSDKNIAEIIFTNNKLENQVLTTKVSGHYNEFFENLTIKTTLKSDGFASIITVISTNQKNNFKPVSVEKVKVHSNFKNIIFEDKIIEAFTITKGTNKYTVVAAHQDYAAPTDSFTADGCIGFGHVVVFDREKNQDRIGEVLVW